MGYLYDFHVHTEKCSVCASSTIDEVIRAEKAAGYAGMVLTNHFLTSCCIIPEEWPWEDKMRFYWKPFVEGQKIASELDFDLFFGVEFNYGNAQEILLYGIDLDFLIANPDMCEIPVEELADRARAYGGYVSHSHPFRERAYIPKGNFFMDMSHIDAIEVYNSANSEIADIKAFELADRLGLGYTAGNDLHNVVHLQTFPHSGLVFEHRIRTSDELIKALKNREGKPFYEGERHYK